MSQAEASLHNEASSKTAIKSGHMTMAAADRHSIEIYRQQEADLYHQQYLALERQKYRMHQQLQREHEEQLKEEERIRNKKENEQSAIASDAVKAKLRECLLNKATSRPWLSQHNSLEQHSPPTQGNMMDENHPLRKTSSEPNLKVRLALKQRMLDRRHSPISKHKRPALPQHSNSCGGGDSGPDTPPSDAHLSLPNISLPAALGAPGAAVGHPGVHGLGSAPHGLTDSMEERLRALVLAQSMGQLVQDRLVDDPVRLSRTLSAPLPVPPYMYMMMMCDEPKEFLKQKLQTNLENRISSKCHLETEVDQETEARLAQELRDMKADSQRAHGASQQVKEALFQKVMHKSRYSALSTSPPIPEDPTMTTGIAYNSLMLQHKCICGSADLHPENPERLATVVNYLDQCGLMSACQRLEGHSASLEELRSCHSEPYALLYGTNPQTLLQTNISPKMFEPLLSRFCALPCGGLGVDPDTVWNEQFTPTAARMAVGCCVDIAMSVAQGKIRNGFALVRPPGHHAEPTVAMGFCYFNSVAIATKQLLDTLHLQRILLVDWDVHHGNSTQQIFYADPRVLYVSLHRHDDGNFFPGTGDPDECGIDRGRGFNVNIAFGGFLKPPMGDAEYMAAFRTVVMPIARDFNPQIVLVSAGFDGAIGHPDAMGGYKISPLCYGHLTRQLMSLASGRVVLVLEGGFDTSILCQCVDSCLRALQGHSLPALPLHEVLRVPCTPARETLAITHRNQLLFWPCLQAYTLTIAWPLATAQQHESLTSAI